MKSTLGWGRGEREGRREGEGGGRKGGERTKKKRRGRWAGGTHADVPQAKQRFAYVTCHIFLYSGVA